MNDPASPSAEPVDVLIIGAGISGIGMAAHLQRRLPHKTFTLVERRQRIGGTWDLFRYPGVRSDSDMYTLGYVFAPWRGKRATAQGHEILGYLDEVARAHDLDSRTRLGTRIVSADWNGIRRYWTVSAIGPDGKMVELLAKFLFAGAGYYDQDQAAPVEIAGLDRFAGHVLHPQFWPEKTDVSGKRVVVIGSGATAVSMVPALAKEAASVTMLQRTPSWYHVQPGTDRFARFLHFILPERWAYRLVRARNNAIGHWFFRQARMKPEKTAKFLLDHARKHAGDTFIPENFTPPYAPWEQRLCLVPDSDLFVALRNGSARIVTGTIDGIDAKSIRLADGQTIEADVIVTATGLQLAPLGGIAVSIDGQPVNFADRWYYRGAMFSNVPNFAALFGYLNAAWTARVDLVADRLCRLFAQMDAWGCDIVVPFLAEDHALEESDPLAGFSSGYLERGRHLIPKSAKDGPWRLSHDILSDAREMREAPIDDGLLRFQ